MVSSANARGVMQVMPGTWSYVQDNLADRALDPNSATDNVHAGVLYLKRLLDDTGGDESAAIAGYYQGLASVRSRGMYDDTQQYVANVQALRAPLRRLASTARSRPRRGGRVGVWRRASRGCARHQPRRGEAERQRRQRDERPRRPISSASTRAEQQRADDERDRRDPRRASAPGQRRRAGPGTVAAARDSRRSQIIAEAEDRQRRAAR